MRCSPALIGLTLLLPGAVRAAAQQPGVAVGIDTVVVDSVVRTEMTRLGSPGVAVAIVHDDRVIFARGYGTASVEENTPVTPETLFRIGSVTKVITGLAALSLRQDGALDFDRPIATQLPGLHERIGRLTMHELLTHTAGMIALPAAHGSRDDDALRRRVLAWTDSVLFADAGEVYSYSSPGYWLAGAVVEGAAGMDYADVVRSRVFEPLGMVRSTLRPLEAFTWPVALDHVRSGDSMVVARPYPDDASTWPGGSVFSSVSELALLARALLRDGMLDGRHALPAASVRAVHQPHAAGPAGECAYTYGLSHCELPNGVTLSHFGFRSGSGAVFTLVPSHDIAIIVLANSAGAIFGRTNAAILGMLGFASDGVTPSAARTATAQERAAAAGTYVAGSDTIRVTDDKDGLRLHARGAAYAVLIDGNDPEQILVTDTQGRVVQAFRLVQGRGTGRSFLHDGLNAFRRLDWRDSVGTMPTPRTSSGGRHGGRRMDAVAHGLNAAHLADFNAAGGRPREVGSQTHGGIHVLRLDDVEACEQLLRLRERTVHH